MNYDIPPELERITLKCLLNYAAIDDYPLQEGKPGWVSQLHRNLEVKGRKGDEGSFDLPGC